MSFTATAPADIRPGQRIRVVKIDGAHSFTVATVKAHPYVAGGTVVTTTDGGVYMSRDGSTLNVWDD